MSRYLGLTPKQFIPQYTTMSAQEDDEIILRRNDAGCIFLDGNDCNIYEARPDTCKLFPHLVRGGGLDRKPDVADDRPGFHRTVHQFDSAQPQLKVWS